MLSTCIFNCNDTDSWKKNRYHLLSKSGFPNLLWRFIATSVVVARNRVVMDAPLFSSEKTRNETQLKSQRHSTAFPWATKYDAPETVCIGKLARGSTKGPPVERALTSAIKR
jgi:hypothetical protein